MLTQHCKSSDNTASHRSGKDVPRLEVSDSAWVEQGVTKLATANAGAGLYRPDGESAAGCSRLAGCAQVAEVASCCAGTVRWPMPRAGERNGCA